MRSVFTCQTWTPALHCCVWVCHAGVFTWKQSPESGFLFGLHQSFTRWFIVPRKWSLCLQHTEPFAPRRFNQIWCILTIINETKTNVIFPSRFLTFHCLLPGYHYVGIPSRHAQSYVHTLCQPFTKQSFPNLSAIHVQRRALKNDNVPTLFGPAEDSGTQPVSIHCCLCIYDV